jgi:hypothetical protein
MCIVCFSDSRDAMPCHTMPMSYSEDPVSGMKIQKENMSAVSQSERQKKVDISLASPTSSLGSLPQL